MTGASVPSAGAEPWSSSEGWWWCTGFSTGFLKDGSGVLGSPLVIFWWMVAMYWVLSFAWVLVVAAHMGVELS